MKKTLEKPMLYIKLQNDVTSRLPNCSVSYKCIVKEITIYPAGSIVR